MKRTPGAWQRIGLAAACRGIFGPVAATSLVAAAALIAPHCVYAQGNSIESVSSSRQGDTTYLRIRMANPPASAPVGFTIANPPRIALDLPETANATGHNSVELGQGEVRKVNIVSAAGRARLVLSLKRAVAWRTEIEGRDIIVALEPMASAAASTPAPASSPFARADVPAVRSAPALRDIDFRRGADGAGRVLVELSDSQVGVDIRQEGQAIVVDFQNAQLPQNLARQLDVGDFGTPVRFVRAQQRPEGTRLVIEPNGLWEHNAYQSERQFVLEVKPIAEDPTKLVQGPAGTYRGDRLSLNFQNIDVRALLQVIADFTNLNIVTSDSVQGTLTLRLKDVPWDQALDIVLQSRGLDMRKNGNVLLIAPQEELATKEKLELEARQQIAEIEPLRTETFQLNYQKAENLQKLLASDKQRVLSKRGSVVIDQRTNKLFVQDIAARLEDVRKLINQVDVSVRQVLIEARIVEADDRFSRNLGVKLGYNDLRSTIYRTTSITDPVTGTATALNVPVYGAGSKIAGSSYATIGGNLSGAADLSSQMGSGLSGLSARGIGRATALDNTNFVNLPAAAIGGAAPASFAISLFGSSLTRFLNLEVSALEADQRGKVVSSPRVLTADQGKAVIEQGTELPYQESTSSGATAVTFRKANLKLEVTPQITPEGNVILEVEVNRDAVGIQTAAGFAIDTRRVQTQVLVENGGTVVIGGIYEQVERNQTNKVPLLGDIPILGNAFKNNSRTNDRTELLVFLTPRVVTDTALAR